MASGFTYRDAGVDIEGKDPALGGFLHWLGQTHGFPGAVGRPVLENGFYAAIHDLGNGLGVAISTDSVGTKMLVAESAGRYDTVGIDCVAINANDILSVGARPIALVDYLAVHHIDAAVLERLGQSLYEGARQAGIAIAGGELAQVPEMIRGASPGHGVDLAGTCIGVVALDRIIDGRAIADGDVVVGLASSGLHSNGYTLARRVLLGPAGYSLDAYVPALGCALADELLRPTAVYVPPVLDLLAAGVAISGLAHISGGGLLNLLRFNTGCGFDLNGLPEPPAIFKLVAERGSVAAEEMCRVFNMGVGFCVVVRPAAVPAVIQTAGRHGLGAWPMGAARRGLRGRVVLAALGLVGEGNAFRRG